MPKSAKKTMASASKSLTLKHRARPPGTSEDAVRASMAVEGLAHNAVTAVQFSESPMGELGLTECLEALTASVAAVHSGNLRGAEALLVGQAVALNAIFTNLALRAKLNMGDYPDATDRYMRLALKAQTQCRATLETLATIKNPPTVFARQANIAHGPQQVNNGVPVARAENLESEQNKLLEAHGERLDGRATNPAGTRDYTLAPVGTVNRPANR